MNHVTTATLALLLTLAVQPPAHADPNSICMVPAVSVAFCTGQLVIQLINILTASTCSTTATIMGCVLSSND